MCHRRHWEAGGASRSLKVEMIERRDEEERRQAGVPFWSNATLGLDGGIIAPQRNGRAGYFGEDKNTERLPRASARRWRRVFVEQIRKPEPQGIRGAEPLGIDRPPGVAANAAVKGAGAPYKRLCRIRPFAVVVLAEKEILEFRQRRERP